MKSRKQPTPEELNKNTIYLTHISHPGELPKERGFKKSLEYITQLHDRPGETYMEASYRRPIEKENLEHWLKTKQIIELQRPIPIFFNTKVYINEMGEVGVDCSPDHPNGAIISRPKSLNYGHMLLANLKTNPCPYYILPKND